MRCSRCGGTYYPPSSCRTCEKNAREQAAHEFDQESGTFLTREVSAMLRFGASPGEIRRLVELEILSWGQRNRRAA